jgi:tellurite resistance protein
MSVVPRPVTEAVEVLCARFEAGDYNPTPLIDIGALIANADGVVDAEEIDTLRRILQPMLGEELEADVVGFLIDASVRVIQGDGVDARARLVAEILMDCDAVEQGLKVALGVAFASNGYSDAEKGVIDKLARAMNFPQPQLDALVAKMRELYSDIPPQSQRRKAVDVDSPRE